MKQKIIVILGPTASGKSDLAVEVALKFNGEIISADSRQVYKGLDIATGKITEAEMKGVRHYLLDVADFHQRFTVAEWKRQAEAAITEIISHNKVPIMCGGTGFYISALVDNMEFPDIEVDDNEQKEFEAKSSQELMQELQALDPDRAARMSSHGEATNNRRLARAILIARELGAVPKQNLHSNSNYDPLLIGIRIPDDELKTRIRKRLIRRLDAGMIEEVQKLHENDLSYARMNELGLEYRYLAEFLQKKITREQLIETLSTKIWQYARRQKTWFKRDSRVHWIAPNEFSTVLSTIAQFLSF